MTKSLTFIPLILMSVCLIVPAFGTVGDACANPLVGTYTGFNPLPNSAAISEELKYCKSLKSESCCPAATINAFQTKANALQAEIVAIVEKRDKLLVDNRDTEIPKIATKLANLKTKATAAETYMKNTASSTFADGKQLTKDQVTTFTTTIKDIATQATTGLATLKTNLAAFQKARATCMAELIKTQASAWCLACDPTWSSRGVANDQSISLDDETCGRLESSCYDYIAAAAAQSNLILAQQLNAGIDDAIDGLDTISKGTASGIDKLITAVKAIEAGVKTTPEAAAVKAPTGCTSKTTCTWICSTVLNVAASGAGAIDKNLAAKGGELNKPIAMPVVSGGGGRILLDGAGRSLDGEGRSLAGTTWKPAVDESGVTITFPQDPAKINQSTGANSAPKLVGGFLCMIMTLFGALLF